jgi:hypothetical protein
MGFLTHPMNPIHKFLLTFHTTRLTLLFACTGAIHFYR